jgi:hypothetical protein
MQPEQLAQLPVHQSYSCNTKFEMNFMLAASLTLILADVSIHCAAVVAAAVFEAFALKGPALVLTCNVGTCEGAVALLCGYAFVLAAAIAWATLCA